MKSEAADYQACLESEVEEERRHAENQLRLLSRSNEAESQEVKHSHLSAMVVHNAKHPRPCVLDSTWHVLFVEAIFYSCFWESCFRSGDQRWQLIMFMPLDRMANANTVNATYPGTWYVFLTQHFMCISVGPHKFVPQLNQPRVHQHPPAGPKLFIFLQGVPLRFFRG